MATGAKERNNLIPLAVKQIKPDILQMYFLCPEL